MERKIRVGAVSYLNTKPLIYGFDKGMMENEVKLIIDYPAKIAAMLTADEIDIGLVPVAIIPSLSEFHIVSDYCIAADGEVHSVCLFSKVPLHQISEVLLDYQSRSSVALLKVLLKEYWKIEPLFQKAEPGYIEQIAGSTAGLIIGDRALIHHESFPFVYDLGSAWKDLTGLPFVFAAWVSNKTIDPGFLERFNEANKTGLQNLDKVIEENKRDGIDLGRYYNSNIQYKLDDKKRQGLELFLSKLS